MIPIRLGAEENLCVACQAHHIIPGNQTFASAAEARAILAAHKIDINSFINGVWLDKKQHFTSHPEKYSNMVRDRIRDGAKDGKSGIHRELKKLQAELQSGLHDSLLVP